MPQILLDPAFTAVENSRPMDEGAVTAPIAKGEEDAKSGAYE